MEEYIKSVIERLDMEKILQESQSEEERKEILLEDAMKLIESDVSLSKLDVENLLVRSTPLIGDIIYQMDNWGKEIPEVSFFGEKAREFFVFLACGYLEIHMGDIVEDFQTCIVPVYRREMVEITVAELRALTDSAYDRSDKYDEKYKKAVAKLEKGGTGYLHGRNLMETAERYGIDTLCFAPDSIEF